MGFNTIGTDIEIFAVDKKGNHKSLCGLIGGTKDAPKQVEGLRGGFCVQEDNVSLEYNIPPTNRKDRWVEYNKVMIKTTVDLLKPYGFNISSDSSASFNAEELTHPNALVFGCEPDYNAWTRRENDKPRSENELLRTAGGHIHVGTDMDIVQGVKQMDLLLGVPSVLLDDTESSRNRRKLYGKAGALRPKPYGFEYRTLSNFWVFSDTLMSWVFDQTYLAVSRNYNITEEQGDMIQHTINTGDKDAARAIIESFGLTLPYSV
jgi:Phage phiEco32-like COOH.NH2 ligase-type 2